MTQQNLSISEHCVDLWLIDPNDHHDKSTLEAYSNLLTAEEKARIDRFINLNARHEALVTRAFVRTLLSYYTQGDTAIEPQQWRFEKGDKGKPEIIDPPLPLRFNLSHTEGLIVCAVTLNADIGVDVEYILRKNDYLKIAKYKFAPSEVNTVINAPKHDQRHHFYNYWTLKESYIKAIGAGLSVPLDQFYFDIKDDSNVAINFTDQLPDNGDNWQHWLLQPTSTHRIALSVHHTHQVKLERRVMRNIPLIGFEQISLPIELTSTTTDTITKI